MAGLGGKYRLGRKIGGGGMAEVYEATVIGAEGFARPVAVKRILPVLSSDPGFGEMFVNEARIAALLHHPNVVSVLDFDRDDEGRHYLVMELVQGVDLRQLADSGRLPAPIIALIVSEVLRGLHYAHELVHGDRHLGIVHRDVSPHNVMISWDGGIKLVDFGIAKAVSSTHASRSGAVKGKVAYMSPEQAHGERLDGRSDLFAVGVILHELLTGQRLFPGRNEPEILSRLLTQPIPRPDEIAPEAPPDLAAAAVRMLERDRERRCPDARSALEVILGCASASPRAGLDLVELLQARFPGQAPARRHQSAPAFAQTLPGAATAPARPSALAPSGALPAPAPAGAAAPAQTLTAEESRRTPTGAGERSSRSGRRGGSASAMIAAALVVLAVGAIGTAFVIEEEGGGGRLGRAALAAAEADAGGAALEGERREVKSGDERDAGTRPEPGQRSRPGPGVDAAPAEDRAGGSGVRPPKERARRRRARRPRSGAGGEDAEPGRLRLVVKPWAEIRIDGRPRGQTPKTFTLPAGRYQIELRNPELGQRATFTAEVRPKRFELVERDWR